MYHLPSRAFISLDFISDFVCTCLHFERVHVFLPLLLYNLVSPGSQDLVFNS